MKVFWIMNSKIGPGIELRFEHITGAVRVRVLHAKCKIAKLHARLELDSTLDSVYELDSLDRET